MGELDKTDDGCPLSPAEQTRNVLVVGINTALCYLAAPVLYVDVIHTALLDKLQKAAGVEPRDSLSNMPASMYMVFCVAPLLVAWAFPQIRLLRRILVLCYATLALGSATIWAALMLPLPWEVQAAVIVAHGGLVGAARTVGVAFEFEVLGIAVSAARRGQALGLAYGLGPILAIFANLLSQFMLTGKVWALEMPALSFPNNFAAVFAFTVPVMLLATYLSSRLIIPLPEQDAVRLPFVAGVFGGIAQFLSRRVVLLAVVSCILIFNGYQAIGNLSLFCGEILGEDAAQTAGYQKAILYTFKAVMGVAMGWLLTRASPRSAVLCSSSIGLSAFLVAILAPTAVLPLGPVALKGIFLSFGLLGMGQLYGIYITNYILSCAPPHLMRRYMALTMLTGLVTAPAGVIFGMISDHFGADGAAKTMGYQASLATAAGLILAGIMISLVMPRWPRPEDGATAPTPKLA